MSDADEIRALVNSYAAYSTVAMWTPLPASSSTRHGDISNGSTLRGSTEVRPVYDDLPAQGGGYRTRHLITNLSVDVEPGAATASSHWPPNRST